MGTILRSAQKICVCLFFSGNVCTQLRNFCCLSDFVTNKEMIIYKDMNDLSEKILKFKKDKKEGKKIAKNGKMKYFK